MKGPQFVYFAHRFEPRHYFDGKVGRSQPKQASGCITTRFLNSTKQYQSQFHRTQPVLYLFIELSFDCFAQPTTMQRHTFPRRCATTIRSIRHASSASAATTAPPSSSSSSPPLRLRAAMLLHRSPLLTSTPTPFESAYYTYTSSLRAALSNPAPLDFFYKKGSLTERRFLKAQYERDVRVFGERLAGRKVDVGDIPEEEGVKLVQRFEDDEPGSVTTGEREDQEEEEGTVREKTKVERVGAGDVYLLVKEKSTGRWGLPVGSLNGKEALHEVRFRAFRFLPCFPISCSLFCHMRALFAITHTPRADG